MMARFLELILHVPNIGRRRCSRSLSRTGERLNHEMAAKNKSEWKVKRIIPNYFSSRHDEQL
jgi:hypothetical protein